MEQPLIALVTTGFPHGVGEQFLATEMTAWAGTDARLVVLPGSLSGPARALPPNAVVDDALARRWSSRQGMAAQAAAALTDPALRRELADLRRRGALTRTTATWALRAVAQARIVEQVLADVARRRGTIDVAYTYWLKPHTAGAVRAREAGHVRRVISRAHGTDLYEEPRPGRYNPLVRTVSSRLDVLYPISEQGAEYVQQRYGLTPGQVRAARLGVTVPAGDEVARPAAADELSLLSVSSMTPLKRMDVLVEAIALVAQRRPGLSVRWRHVGDGPLRPTVERSVAERLVPLGVTVELAGHLPHGELLASIAEQPTDLFLNVSASEGVPVSIMEAGVREVPAVATDVGATREVVTEGTGWLVPAGAGAEVIAQQVLDCLDQAREPGRRRATRELVTTRFDAARNFAAFVEDVLGVAR